MRSAFITLGVVIQILSPVAAHAARLGFDCSPHACGQPLSTGTGPTVTDCLFVLDTAVGNSACDPCLCDVNRRDPGVSATDALACLHASVGVAGLLECPCVYVPPQRAPGTFELVVEPASIVDAGSTGAGHDATIGRGISMFAEVVRRCDGTGSVCDLDSDCSGTEFCVPTCGVCSGEDSQCEVAGAVDSRRCLLATSKTCVSNADCALSEGTCEKLLGPPQPFTAGGVPTCVSTYFAEDLTGTTNLVSGTWELSAFLRTRVLLGLRSDQPCPRCGAAADSPRLGDTFNCEGGPRAGAACTVDAVSPSFGGTSFDCPPNAAANVSGPGLAIRLDRISTGVVSSDAVLPCGGPLGSLHPSNGGAVCMDTFTTCSTNADCLRCTNDPTARCASNADCVGEGRCADAPGQPIACGLYCHCGFCNGDPDAPCLRDAQCSNGETCEATTDAQAPNDCHDLVCGRVSSEHCCVAAETGCATPTPLSGVCVDRPYVSCSTDGDCTSAGAVGPCALSARPCFENRISRNGAPSPLGSYCTDDPTVDACTDNSDCEVGDCVSESAKPTLAALFCVPPTGSNAVNATYGLAGPVAFEIETSVLTYRCGDGLRNGIEECDDGNNLDGDGCSGACKTE